MGAQAPDAVVARIDVGQRDVGRRDVGRVPLADLGPQTTDALPPRWPGHDRATSRPRPSSAAGVRAGPTLAAAPAAGVRQLLDHLAETATAGAATEESRVRQRLARSARSAPELDEALPGGGAT